MYNTNWYLGSIISAWVSSCPLASSLSYLTLSRRASGRIYALKKVCGRGVCQPLSKLSFLWFKSHQSGELWCYSQCYVYSLRRCQVYSRVSSMAHFQGTGEILLHCFAVIFLQLNKEEKASKVLAKYHANGGNEHDPLVVFEVAQIRHAIKMEAEINRRTSYWSLFSTPGNRKRMMIIMAIAIFSQWRSVF
jgi:hypothetical protein